MANNGFTTALHEVNQCQNRASKMGWHRIPCSLAATECESISGRVAHVSKLALGRPSPKMHPAPPGRKAQARPRSGPPRPRRRDRRPARPGPCRLRPGYPLLPDQFAASPFARWQCHSRQHARHARGGEACTFVAALLRRSKSRAPANLDQLCGALNLYRGIQRAGIYNGQFFAQYSLNSKLRENDICHSRIMLEQDSDII
jgi:hypothetical protein